MSDKRTGKKAKKPALSMTTNAEGVEVPVATPATVTAKKRHRK